MGRSIVFRGKLVTCLLAISLIPLLGGNSSPVMEDEDKDVLCLHFDYTPPSTGLSTTIEVGFDVRPIIAAVGGSLTVRIRLSNQGNLPVDVAELPIYTSMEKLDIERNIWKPIREGTPFLLEGDGIYLSEGIKGFYPTDQIQAMKNTVLKAGQEEHSWSCVPPVYALRGEMTVEFQQNLTFLKEGHWRLVYNINGDVYYRDIISQGIPDIISVDPVRGQPIKLRM